MTTRLPENLDLIATASEGIRKLRGLILELAVRGKLVPQDPDDEPASELLKRIAKERARLEADGKIKKAKQHTPVGEDEKPFDLPNTWEWSRLGIVSEKLTDGSHSPPPDFGSGLPMLSSQNVQDGWIDTRNPSRYLSEQDFDSEDSRTKVSTGDVLLTIVASIGRSAVVTKEHCRFALQRSVAVIKSGLAPDFLSIQLRAPVARSYYDKHGKGTAQKGIYLGKLGEMPVAIPPLAEQHRIVAKVDELMALCDRLEAEQADAGAAHARLVATLLGTLTQSTGAAELAANWQRLAEHFDTLITTESSLDALKQTLLQLAVMGKLVPQDPNDEPASELLKRIAKERERLEAEGACKKSKPMPPINLDDVPFELPYGWAWARFPEVGHFARGKSRHRPRNDPSLFNPGIYPLVQTGEVARADTTVREYHSKYSEVGLRQSKMWPRGTLCITIAANIADSAILGFAACFPDSVVGLVPSQLIGDARYFLWFMKTARQELLRFAPATAQKNINLEILESVRIPLPPKGEMSRIVAKVDELMALCDRLKAGLAESRGQQERLSTTLIETALQAA